MSRHIVSAFLARRCSAVFAGYARPRLARAKGVVKVLSSNYSSQPCAGLVVARARASTRKLRTKVSILITVSFGASRPRNYRRWSFATDYFPPAMFNLFSLHTFTLLFNGYDIFAQPSLIV